MTKIRFIAITLIILLLVAGFASGSSIELRIVNKTENNEYQNQANLQTNSANTIYVDDDREPGWYDASHVRTIQEGIENASHYDNVFVYNGTYYENIFINRRVNLIGEDRNETIIDGAGKGHVVSIFINGVELRGFTIRNSRRKILGDSAGIVVGSHNNTICHNIILENLYGIYINRGTNNIISNNIIKNNKHKILPGQGVGIYLLFSYNNSVIENTIIKNPAGIVIAASNYNNISGNIIKRNRFGVTLQTTLNDRTPPSNNVITGNIISLNRKGINLFESNNNDVVGNAIKGNIKGVVLSNCKNNNITKNNFVFNLKQAEFQFEELSQSNNKWDKNYWNRPRLTPYPIIGYKLVKIPLIPRRVKLRIVKLDWHPALKPYEI